MSGKHHVAADIHCHLWVFQHRILQCPLSCGDRRCDRLVLFRAEHATVSYSLRVSQLWVSVLLAILLQIEAFPMRTKMR